MRKRTVIVMIMIMMLTLVSSALFFIGAVLAVGDGAGETRGLESRCRLNPCQLDEECDEAQGRCVPRQTTLPCGAQTCTRIEETCRNRSDCDRYGGGPQVGESLCNNGHCYLAPLRLQRYRTSPVMPGVPFADIKMDIQIKKPILEINIPQLTFSDVASNVDSEGYLHLPWIGEYLTALYKFALGVVSIFAVVMIMKQGFDVVLSRGGEEKVNAYKKVASVIIGVAIAWGSYAILYNINPDLVRFKALKVKYIQEEPMPDIASADSDNNPPPGAGRVAPGNCNNYDALFQKYAPCLGGDWRTFKAIAAVESGCNPTVDNGRGYVGMFQTNVGNCREVFSKSTYRRFINLCTIQNLKNPEFAIAFASLFQKGALSRIKRSCGNATADMQGTALHSYHNVPAGAIGFISKGCRDINDFINAFLEFYQDPANANKKRRFFNDRTYSSRYDSLKGNETAYLRAIATQKIEYARDRAGPTFASLGGNVRNSAASDRCPLDDSGWSF